jgi:hypothetical protein
MYQDPPRTRYAALADAAQEEARSHEAIRVDLATLGHDLTAFD